MAVYELEVPSFLQQTFLFIFERYFYLILIVIGSALLFNKRTARV
jgi:hypothetical protein